MASEKTNEPTQRFDNGDKDKTSQETQHQQSNDEAQLVPATAEEEADDTAVLIPGLEVTYPSLEDKQNQPNVITQDWNGPSQNTRVARRQRPMAAVEVSCSSLSTAQAARREFQLKILVDMAAAALDEETGNLLEYRQLIKKSKTRDR